MTIVELNLGGVTGTVDVEEMKGGDRQKDGHYVRFFHVMFNQKDPPVPPVTLAAAIANDPQAFYEQCRNAAALNLPGGAGASRYLWTRVRKNLTNDVRTIRDVHKTYGSIPVCATCLVSWFDKPYDTLVDFRMGISTHYGPVGPG
jgi:putative intracellular protease/amidase